MILKQSRDATLVLEFRNIKTKEIIEHEESFSVDCDLFDDETLEFIGYKTIACIQDEWNQSLPYISKNNSLLLECDYCKKDFATTQEDREKRISAFKKTVKKSNHLQHSDDDDDYQVLYKDNCKKCRHHKKSETMVLTGGDKWYENLSEEQKEEMKLKSVRGVKYSRGQQYISDLLDGKINVPVGKYYADIVVGNSIVVEYDGSGHWLSVERGSYTLEAFNEKELEREKFFFEEGYKTLRIVSKGDYIPENKKVLKDLLLEAIADLVLSDDYVSSIDFDKNSKNYGQMYHISRISNREKKGNE